jgi:hypothetical protein
MAALPAAFGIDDMPLDLSVLRRLAESVAAQFPIFRDIALQEHRGGLPTMTADGEHVVGPAPGISGLYVIGGCCVGGLTTAQNGSPRDEPRRTWRSWRRIAWRPESRRTSCASFAGCNTRITIGHRRQCRRE